ncbi:hypothetical protein DFH07DRAFT_114827, partial [Mycena maculata]
AKTQAVVTISKSRHKLVTKFDAAARRSSNRAEHLENAAQIMKAGVLRVGGVLLMPESLMLQDKKMVGSTMIFKAESIEAVRTLVERDIYYTSGVWDLERLVILPFIAATPLP